MSNSYRVWKWRVCDDGNTSRKKGIMLRI